MNPLVICLPNSDYEGSMQSLDGPKRDCQAIAFCMNYKRGYTLWYCNENNILRETGCDDGDTSAITESKINSSEYGGVENFKLRWETNEISQFNDKILKKLNDQYKQFSKQKQQQQQQNKMNAQTNAQIDEKKDEETNQNDADKQDKQNKQNNEKKNEKMSRFDGLIYFISGHGKENGVFLDSECNEIDLAEEFFNRFNNGNCRYFYGKPKLFVVDCCRGKLVSIKSSNDKYRRENKNTNTNKNKNKNNNSSSKPYSTSSTTTGKTPQLLHPVMDKDEQEEHDEKKTDTVVAVVDDNAYDDGIGKRTKKDALTFDAYRSGAMMSSMSGMSGMSSMGIKVNVDGLQDIRVIFGNPDGYALVDSTNGGYLTYSLLSVLSKDDNIKNNVQFNDIRLMANKVMNKLIGKQMAQVIEDHNNWSYDIILKAKVTV